MKVEEEAKENKSERKLDRHCEEGKSERVTKNRSIAMVCRSPNVQRVADKTNHALEAINTLEDGLMGQVEAFQKDFSRRMNEALERSKINDALLMTSGVEIKVDFASEFNIDAITKVVADAIKSYGAATAKTGSKETESLTAAATSKDALDSYVTLVNSIGEAAKSSSSSSGSFSFSMNRLGPGMFLFISAKSSNLKEVETFGQQVVTATSFIFNLMRSENDIMATTHFDKVLIQAAAFKAAAELDVESIKKFKVLQMGLIDRIGKDLDIDAYSALDAKYELVVETKQKTLDNEHFKTQHEPQGRLLGSEMHPSASHAPHNFAFINMSIKQMRWKYDHENLQYINLLHGVIYDNLDHDENCGGVTGKQVIRPGLTPGSQVMKQTTTVTKLSTSEASMKEQLLALEKAAEAVKRRLDKNAVGNINEAHTDTLLTERSMPLAVRRMTDGHAAGTIVNGEHIYWNQHITFDTANPPSFDRHSTTQIRLRVPDSNIIGSIRTFQPQNGNAYTKMSPGNLRQLIPDYLYTWAEDAHDTFTTEHL